jgi:hypothetical protein
MRREISVMVVEVPVRDKAMPNTAVARVTDSE